MPEHTSFFTYVVARLFEIFPALKGNLARLQHVVNHDEPVNPYHDGEALFTSIVIVVGLILVAFALRPRLVAAAHKGEVIPDDKLTTRTFFEVFVGYFYDMAKDVMGPRRAKQFFPVIGAGACFIFFSNILGLIPGFIPPTSTWNITIGCALVVFVLFNYYGTRENGWQYWKHYLGPIPALYIFLGPLELFSMVIRPVTLSVRLMLNMAVDHLLLGIVLGLVPLLVPVPLMMLGTLVALVQTLVFCLLTAVYIGMATEEHEHDHAPGAHGAAHEASHGAKLEGAH
jgi:F-type H+-transporting ATPase subunit a